MPLAEVCGESRKPCYSHDEAKHKAKLARRRTDDRALREYHCRHCGWWHWGHGIATTRKLNLERKRRMKR